MQVSGEFTFFFVLQVGYIFSAICIRVYDVAGMWHIRVELIARNMQVHAKLHSSNPTVQARNPLM